MGTETLDANATFGDYSRIGERMGATLRAAVVLVCVCVFSGGLDVSFAGGSQTKNDCRQRDKDHTSPTSSVVKVQLKKLKKKLWTIWLVAVLRAARRRRFRVCIWVCVRVCVLGCVFLGGVCVFAYVYEYRQLRATAEMAYLVVAPSRYGVYVHAALSAFAALDSPLSLSL